MKLLGSEGTETSSSSALSSFSGCKFWLEDIKFKVGGGGTEMFFMI